MNTSSCINIFQRYPLDFIRNITVNDPLLILEAIKSFKDPNYKSTSVNVFDGREINLLTEFFSRYGESIRYNFFN